MSFFYFQSFMLWLGLGIVHEINFQLFLDEFIKAGVRVVESLGEFFVFFVFAGVCSLGFLFLVHSIQWSFEYAATYRNINNTALTKIIYNLAQKITSFMLERRGRTSQSWIPTRYESTKNQFKFVDRYIVGITREQVSQYITNFPFIYYIYKKNTPNDQWKLLDQLMKVPSESDGPGFIYGFMNEKENCLLQAPYWIKIGRTKLNPPQQRIFQWQKDDQAQITEIFTVRTLYQKKLQSLIHTLFAYARKNRQINGKLRVEWFHFDEITLTAAAVNILNHIMNTLHTSKLENKTKQYMNRNLKQITEKIKQSNNQINDIVSTPHLAVVESFVRDLGIQMGRNQEVKIKLRDCQDFDKMMGLVGEFVIGKQLKEFFQVIGEMEDIIGKYLESIAMYRKETFQNIKQIYQKTKINLVNYDIKPPINKTPIKISSPTQQKPKQTKPKPRETKITIQKQPKPQKSTNKKKPDEAKTKSPITKHKQIQDKSMEAVINQKQIEQRIRQLTLTVNIQNYIFGEERPMEVEIPVQAKVDEKMEVFNVRVYNAEGKQQRIEQMSAKEFNNNPLKKYKQNLNNLPKIQMQNYQNQALFHPEAQVDLNQSLNQTVIQQTHVLSAQLTNSNSTLIEFKMSKISEVVTLYKQAQIGRIFLIYADDFMLDQAKLRLDYGYLIMSKKIKIQTPFSIIRSRKYKGYLNVFCSDIEGMEGFKIDEKCQKYVGFYQINAMCQINPLDQYHKNRIIQQPIKELVQRYIKIIKVN